MNKKSSDNITTLIGLITIVLIVCKFMNIVDWSWWIVVGPMCLWSIGSMIAFCFKGDKKPSVTINNVENAYFIFETNNKNNIVEVFNHYSKQVKITNADLICNNNITSLKIDLSLWQDIDDRSDFENVIKVFKKINNPIGGNSALVIKSKIVGYDKDAHLNFMMVCHGSGVQQTVETTYLQEGIE